MSQLCLVFAMNGKTELENGKNQRSFHTFSVSKPNKDKEIVEREFDEFKISLGNDNLSVRCPDQRNFFSEICMRRSNGCWVQIVYLEPFNPVTRLDMGSPPNNSFRLQYPREKLVFFLLLPAIVGKINGRHNFLNSTASFFRKKNLNLCLMIACKQLVLSDMQS